MSNLHLKRNLTSQQLGILASEMDKRKKSKGIAFAMWWFLGIFGGHRFYLGDVLYAMAMLFTLGGLGLWTLIDVFLIISRIEAIEDREERKLIAELELGND